MRTRARSSRPKPVVELKPKELTEDPKAFAARVREELHRLLRALGQKRYMDALAMLDNAVGEWTAPKLEQAMAPYFEEHKVVVLTPAARRPSLTFIEEIGHADVGARSSASWTRRATGTGCSTARSTCVAASWTTDRSSSSSASGFEAEADATTASL